MTDRLSKTEIAKDALQEGVESVASTVGEVATIITTAVKDVANAIGGLATDAFAIRDAAKQAAEKADLNAEVSEPAQD
ncbi:hypothetical protein HZU40_09145 [Mycolicibacterium fluoranthenivorans]|jgi:hypothetical protein|uniref:Uncharacterized protein n=1 Tax=Mycolicibacterium fluoranthenivorans TaxID=258505 RepID=A0A1G4WNC6_9MYCO|nr:MULTISPECIES: hypothetical protein [Mycobacteriaceae]MCV7252494.1 hypothetical protein [Mycobacterium hackensackense]MCV7356792.1 hypothetical protein [Mycolicibacterium fluoranthenivorans]NIH94183.1 hypothetical protein [Mycolicibacterium fluoranthenivorans]QNJ94412.1 hypothetical protein HZU40_09145 [Mycolicibacterium fluoranthenivorans]SCX26277.1 hypothetical protein SAMN02799620_04095 [Mycolicibacterium fluoranthenivorans]